ncbi:hypothetical protein ACWF94_29845 [Streptomyces sp. NPDC055078]
MAASNGSNGSNASAVPQIVGGREAPDQSEGAVAQIGGNLAAAWRSWWFWGPGNGTHNLQLPWSVINPNSTVVIEAAEIDGNNVRFVGAAPFTILTIAPGNGIVTFKINIGWNSPIPMRTDVLVFN